MAVHGRRPGVHAPTDRWQLLGELLQLRRGDLGYRRRPAFTRDRDINIRLVTDIENAYRPNTFLTPTLQEVAQAYQVTYESLVAVLRGTAGSLAPAHATGPLPVLPPRAPQSGLLRESADRDYFRAVYDRVLELADAGVRDPTGAQLGLSEDDAKVWDGTRGAMSRGDRAWAVADVQRRRREAREANPEAGASSA